MPQIAVMKENVVAILSLQLVFILVQYAGIHAIIDFHVELHIALI